MVAITDIRMMAAHVGDVITIDNFNAEMTKFNECAKPLFGLVDMGSNGIRFSISDLSAPHSRLLNCVYRERAGISLYDALHEWTPDSKPFMYSAKTIETVAEKLGRFRAICDQYGVPHGQISVFATEAMRTAQNRDEMLEAIKAKSGLSVDLLSPAIESLFGAMGARSGFVNVDGLFMDLGGGSVQMTYIDSKSAGYDVLAAEAAQSMPYGAAKLSEALKTTSQASVAISDLKVSMKRTFEGLNRRFPRLKEQAESAEGITIYFCGGGFRGYGSMLMHTNSIHPYPIPSIGGFKASGQDFKEWNRLVEANNKDGKIFGLSKRRRQQFPAIATVVDALVDTVPHIKDVVFCSGGNREGVLFMKLPPEIRECNPLSLLPMAMSTPTPSFYPPTSVRAIVEVIYSAFPATHNSFPPQLASFCTFEIISYLVMTTWLYCGAADDVNSSRALHEPLSGTIADLPGLTHETRAFLALALCERWGADLGPVDMLLYKNLQLLVGPSTAFWCQYIGTLMKLLGTLFPIFPIDEHSFRSSISLDTNWAIQIGKKCNKSTVVLEVSLKSGAQPQLVVDGINLNKLLEDLFKNVGKGLEGGSRVKAVLA